MSGTIAIYGATGTLGRRVARELLARGASVRLGARDAGRLEALARDLERHAGWSGQSQSASLDDGHLLRALAGGCRVVLNAGPTGGKSEPLIAAALDTGAHYLDAAGSQPYIFDVFERLGPQAERRGTALAPAFGFDYALGDCLAHLVARSGSELRRARHIVVGYAIDGPDVSSNSLQFAADTQAGGERFYESGGWTPARLGVFRRVIDFPAPFGRQPMARYAAGEIVTVPRHTPAEAVTSLITTRSLVPHPALVPVFPYLRPLVAVARRTPARHLLGLAAKLRRAPSRSPAPSADHPPPPAPARRFAIVVEVEGHDGASRRGVVEGGDFHEVTVASLALGAQALAAPGFAGRGALPPAAVVNAEEFLDALGTLGVRWRRY